MLCQTEKFSVIDVPAMLKIIPLSQGNKLYHEILAEADVNGDNTFNASIRDRENLIFDKAVTQQSLIYGEVTTIESFESILETIRPLINKKERGIMIDLGSGSGRACLSTAILASDIFHQAIGVELLPSLYGLSLSLQRTWNTKNINDCKLSFYKGSLLDLACCDWTKASFVFCNSTAFDTITFNSMAKLTTMMAKGSIFVSLTTELPITTGFKMVEELRLDFSWGQADVFIHIKDDNDDDGDDEIKKNDIKIQII